MVSSCRASRVHVPLIARFAALTVLLVLCLSASANAAPKSSPKAAKAGPLLSVKALKARIEALKEKAEKKGFDEETSGTDFLDAYLYFLQQRAYPHDTFDATVYARGYAQREILAPARIGEPSGLPTDTFVPTNTWQFVGPTNMASPARIYNGQGPLSGRINGIAFDPATANTYYVATAGGGVWKTTDGGATWSALSNSWQYQQTSCVSVDPTNSDILYAGTGDDAGYPQYTDGIMKSTDGGATWSTLTTAFGGATVGAILIDPETPTTLTAGTGAYFQGLVWRSTDSGATWHSVLPTFGYWQQVKYGAKSASGVRYYYAASPYTGNSPDEELWRSSDRGATWTKLTIPATGFDFYEGLVIAPSVTNPNVVYLMSGNDQQIWRSTNAGGSWTDITSGLDAAEPALGGNTAYNWSQGNYDINLTCSTETVGGSPVDVVYSSLIDLAQSTNGGTSWQSLGGPTYDGNKSVLHNDQHAGAVNPANASDLLIGCDGGVYNLAYAQSSNTWSFTSLNKNLGITQFYKAAYHPTNPNIMLAGAQDNGTPISTGDLGNWKNGASGDGGGCAINPSNPSQQYLTSENFYLLRTDDGWQTSSFISPNLGSDTLPFVTPVTLDPTSPNLLYAGTNYLYRYNATTSSWASHLGNQPLAGAGYVIQVIAVAPSSGQVIYTGSNDGQVWMSTNQGGNWTQINGGSPALPNRAVTSIDVNPSNPSDVLVGLSGTGGGHVFECANTGAGGGRVWTDLSGSGNSGLPDIPLNTIARDPDHPTTTYYVGNDIGVFATTDGGSTWTNATEPLGLPNVEIDDLKAVSGTHYLNAATFGRGIWRIRIKVVPQVTSFSPTSGPVGTRVNIYGHNFTGVTTVKFNGVSCPAGTFTLDSNFEITATVPPFARTGQINVVTGNGGGNSSTNFTVTASSVPTLTSFSPTSGPVGTSVTITGTNLTGATSVKFNGTSATSYTVNSSTKITAAVPSGATTGKIAVTTSGGTATSTGNFTVTAAGASISGQVFFDHNGNGTQDSGDNGLSGWRVFIDTNGNGTFDAGEPSAVTSSSGNYTISGLSAGTYNVDLVVQTGYHESLPDVQYSGWSVTLTTGQVYTGLPFGATQTAALYGYVYNDANGNGMFDANETGLASWTVFLDQNGSGQPNGTNPTTTSDSTGYYEFTGLTTGATYKTKLVLQAGHRITQPGSPGYYVASSVASGFAGYGPFGIATSSATPTVTSFTPTSGPVGTSVTITGANLTGATSVKFNGTSATSYTVNSSTKITAAVPSGATTGKIAVTTSGGTATSSSNYTVTF